MAFAFDHQLLSKHAFAMVEPAAVDHLPGRIVTEPVVPATLAASTHLMPRLLDLGAQPEPQRAALLAALFDAQRHDEQPALTLLVQTSMRAEEFVRYWNTLQVAAPAPGRKVWLRLHDPRVLHQVLRILTPVQRKKLFGKIERFSYWLGDGWIDAGPHDADPWHLAGTGSALGWDWQRIEGIGTVNRALQGAGIRQAADISRQAHLAEQLIARASERHGLREQADLVEFAVRGLSTHLRFDEHPLVLRAIPPSADPDEETRLTDRFAIIDDHVWAELGQRVPVQEST